MATTLSEDWVGSATKPYLGPGVYIHGHVDGPTATDDFVVVYLEHSPRGTPKALANSGVVVLNGGTSFTAQITYGGDNEGNIVGTSLDIRVQVFHAGFALVSDTLFSAVALWEPTCSIGTLLHGVSGGTDTQLSQILAAVQRVYPPS